MAFAARGQVKAQISLERLEDINDIFERMRRGQLVGRTVLKIA